ncbi:MAG: Rid family hydrolase [Comamonas sp.]
MKDVVNINVYMADLSGFAIVNDVMAATFTAPYPARATIEVAALPKAAGIEIEAVLPLQSA